MSAVPQQAPVHLRPMRADDLYAVLEIEQRVYAFPWTEGIFQDCLQVGYCCWVYEQEGRPIGYGVMSIGAHEAHLLNLCVKPEHQRCGLGRSLLEYLMGLAVYHKAYAIFLEVRPTNRSAIKLYRSLGFQEIGIRKAYYPAPHGREDALILQRKL